MLRVEHVRTPDRSKDRRTDLARWMRDNRERVAAWVVVSIVFMVVAVTDSPLMPNKMRSIVGGITETQVRCPIEGRTRSPSIHRLRAAAADQPRSGTLRSGSAG